MKGSAAVVGATAVRTQAAKLEESLADGQLALAKQCLGVLTVEWQATLAAMEAGTPQEMLKSPDQILEPASQA